jgi:5'-nucleotidase
MKLTLDRYLPGNMTFRLFDVVIVGARKPEFFSSRNPASRSRATTASSARWCPEQSGKAYLGGNAAAVEKSLGMLGRRDPLCRRPHLRGREDIEERSALADCPRPLGAGGGGGRRRGPPGAGGAPRGADGREGAARRRYSLPVRLDLQRLEHGGYGPTARRIDRQRSSRRPSPRCAACSWSSITRSPRWRPRSRRRPTRAGDLLLYAGNDKSHLARQVERSADMYTSRVSNFLHRTPFAYLRSPRGSLPHDFGPTGGVND